MSDKSAKMLERVRALLAKAASTNFPAEADSFRAKADQIMTEYAIDQWMVDQAQDAQGKRPTPERRDMDFGWWRGNPFRHQLWDMFSTVARHCRCAIATTKADYRDLKMPVFGLASDLDWFDLLFTQLMIAMIQKVDPQPRPELTLMENLAMMREAGMPWEDAINRIIRAGEVEDVTIDQDATFDDVYKPWVHEYRRWCRATGHPQSYVNQRTYRKNFADGFQAEINDRLGEMARNSRFEYDKSHEAGTMEIAVRDIRLTIQDLIYAEFPELRPHARDCDCRRCRAARSARFVPVRARSIKGPKIDHAARQAGREAGRQVDLTNNPARRVGSDQGQLGS